MFLFVVSWFAQLLVCQVLKNINLFEVESWCEFYDKNAYKNCIYKYFSEFSIFLLIEIYHLDNIHRWDRKLLVWVSQGVEQSFQEAFDLICAWRPIVYHLKRRNFFRMKSNRAFKWVHLENAFAYIFYESS